MRTRDTAAMRAAFTPKASLQSLTRNSVTFESIEGWISSVVRERFSHSGVDAVQLQRSAGRWRIFSMVHTRQRQGCPPSPAGTKTP